MNNWSYASNRILSTKNMRLYFKRWEDKMKCILKPNIWTLSLPWNSVTNFYLELSKLELTMYLFLLVETWAKQTYTHKYSLIKKKNKQKTQNYHYGLSSIIVVWNWNCVLHRKKSLLFCLAHLKWTFLCTYIFLTLQRHM